MDLQRWLSSGRGRGRRLAGRASGRTSRTRRCRSATSGSPSAFGEFTERLRDNYPFFHPSYAGQMLKPPHPAAVAGYLAAMLINPNNHALDGGPATGADGEGGRGAAGRDVRAAPSTWAT